MAIKGIGGAKYKSLPYVCSNEWQMGTKKPLRFPERTPMLIQQHNYE
jgi:hypothetical protein